MLMANKKSSPCIEEKASKRENAIGRLSTFKLVQEGSAECFSGFPKTRESQFGFGTEVMALQLLTNRMVL
jgi:hypothetical protein